MLCSFGVRAFPLQQQCKIEHRIIVVGCNHERVAEAFDSGFGSPLIVQQVGKIVPGFRKRRIAARGGPQSRFGFDGAAGRPKHI
jgi:hypothetical protein